MNQKSTIAVVGVLIVLGMIFGVTMYMQKNISPDMPSPQIFQTPFPSPTQYPLPPAPPPIGTSIPVPGTTKQTGILMGKATIGPICPVERVDQSCPVPPEAYTSREILVYTRDGKTLLNRTHFHTDGSYSFVLPADTYVLDVPHTGIGGAKDLPKTVIIKAGATVVVDVDIDTGIR